MFLVEFYSLDLLITFVAQLMLQKNRSVVRSNQIFKICSLSFAIAREFRAKLRKKVEILYILK